MENKIIVLGAGIAGISAAYHAQQKYPHAQVKVFEKTNDWGGLCGGFYIKSDLGDFWFDLDRCASPIDDLYRVTSLGEDSVRCIELGSGVSR